MNLRFDQGRFVMLEMKHGSELTAISIIAAVLGAFLFVSPWVLGYSGEQTATWSACVAGFSMGLVALVGFVELREWEGWADVALGVWAACGALDPRLCRRGERSVEPRRCGACRRDP